MVSTNVRFPLGGESIMNHLSGDHGVTAQKHKPLIGSQTLVFCIVIIAIAVTAVTVFKVSVGSLLFIGALLACPLMHVVMMKGMSHKHD